jgi:protein-tyrosine phosphatase
VTAADFERFDLVLAMDDDNLADLREVGPAAQHGKLRRLMEFAPVGASRVVPDPYYGGSAGFERVLDLIELACDGLVASLRSQQGSIPDSPSGIGPEKPE